MYDKAQDKETSHSCPSFSYLYLYRPGEVTDINKEGDVGIVVEVKLFIGEGIFTLFDIRPGDDGNFLTCLCASCKSTTKY